MNEDITEVDADPNADLIGYSFEIPSDDPDLPAATWHVSRTPEWSPGNYVEIVSDNDLRTVRPAGLIRNRKAGESND